MKKYIEDTFDSIMLVSGDGDYKMMVDYFVEQKKFLKVLAPNLRFASSLYKNNNNLESCYFACIDDLRNVLEHKKRAP
jgi:hypothetical protein